MLSGVFDFFSAVAKKSKNSSAIAAHHSSDNAGHPVEPTVLKEHKDSSIDLCGNPCI